MCASLPEVCTGSLFPQLNEILINNWLRDTELGLLVNCTQLVSGIELIVLLD
jgi:hypothetical protein